MVRGKRSVAAVLLLCAGWSVGAAAQTAISAEGIVESKSGGFKFPDGTLQATAAGSITYANIVVVAKSGGDFTTITAALDSIGDASSSNRYLVYVAPGTYSESITMKRWVDLEGAGEGLTKITSAGGPSIFDRTVTGETDSEIRFLSIENTGGSELAAVAFGIASSSPGKATLTNVTLTTSGPAEVAVVVQLYSDALLRSVTVKTQGGKNPVGIGIGALGGTSPPPPPLVTLENVEIVTEGVSVRCDGLRVLNGAKLVARNVRAVASGATQHNKAVEVVRATAELTQLEALAKNGTVVNYGIYIDGSSSSSTGADTAVVEIAHGRLEADGGGSNYGVYTVSDEAGTNTVTINNSELVGATATVFSNDGYTIQVGGSLMQGGPVSAPVGTLTCAGVWDEFYAFFDSSCP